MVSTADLEHTHARTRASTHTHTGNPGSVSGVDGYFDFMTEAEIMRRKKKRKVEKLKCRKGPKLSVNIFKTLLADNES